MFARFWFSLLGLFVATAGPVAAQIAAVTSPSGPVPAGPYLVVDAATGETLLQRDAGAPWYPASLTKLMTIYIAFEELKAGRLQLDTPVPFSQAAVSVEGLNLGVGVGGSIPVDQALTALVVRSANDVSVAVGERISGSTAAFARRMTETAHRIGMTATQFRNASGLPDAGQVTTARDMGVLALALVRDFPQYFGYFQAQHMAFGRNMLKRSVKFIDLYAPFADGMKTGFICASGFNLVGSAVRDGRRLIGVAFGFRRGDLRDEFMARVFDEGFALKTGGNRPKVWQLQNAGGQPPTVLPYGECGTIRYDMPGDAVWLGTYGDWRSARNAYDIGQAELASLGVARLGKEWILPVTINKATKQAAIIADLEPQAAQKLCAAYQAKKLFCEVRSAQQMAAPFSGFWR